MPCGIDVHLCVIGLMAYNRLSQHQWRTNVSLWPLAQLAQEGCMNATGEPTQRLPPEQFRGVAQVVEATLTQRASWIVRASIANPYAVIVLSLFIIVIGLVCLFGDKPIPVDLLPAYRTPAV